MRTIDHSTIVRIDDRRTYVGPVWEEDGVRFVLYQNRRIPVEYNTPAGEWQVVRQSVA